MISRRTLLKAPFFLACSELALSTANAAGDDNKIPDLAPSQIAVVSVDLQGKYVYSTAESRLRSAFGLSYDMPAAEKASIKEKHAPTIEQHDRLIDWARAQGSKIIWLICSGNSADNQTIIDHYEKGSPLPERLRDDLILGKGPQSGDIIIGKTEQSGFDGTILHETLQTHHIRKLFLGGGLDIECELWTVLDALQRGYVCDVFRDASYGHNVLSPDEVQRLYTCAGLQVEPPGFVAYGSNKPTTGCEQWIQNLHFSTVDQLEKTHPSRSNAFLQPSTNFKKEGIVP